MGSRRRGGDAYNPFGEGDDHRQDMSVQDADAMLFGNMDPTVELERLRTDGGTQPRERLDEATVQEYAEDMQRGDRFPPVTVFYDGENYWLTDGFHRVAAAKLAGLGKVRADIKQGTLRDAVLYSLGVNAQHGKRRTNQDKRRAVVTMLQDRDWARWSDNEISRHCKVSQPFVSKLRGELSYNDYKIGDQGAETRKVQRGGQVYEQRVSSDKRSAAQQDRERGALPSADRRERPASPPPTVPFGTVVGKSDTVTDFEDYDGAPDETPVAPQAPPILDELSAAYDALAALRDRAKNTTGALDGIPQEFDAQVRARTEEVLELMEGWKSAGVWYDGLVKLLGALWERLGGEGG